MRDGPQHWEFKSQRLLSTASPFFEPDKSCSIEAVMPAAESAQVDGDKKTVGGYASKMRMDDMPVDWIEQVLSFLPLTDVYKCRSVCMAWHVAADRVLNDWETLVIGEKQRRERPVRADNYFFINRETLVRKGGVRQPFTADKREGKTRPVRDKNQIFVQNDADYKKLGGPSGLRPDVRLEQ